jgi:hypothetical protein
MPADQGGSSAATVRHPMPGMAVAQMHNKMMASRKACNGLRGSPMLEEDDVDDDDADDDVPTFNDVPPRAKSSMSHHSQHSVRSNRSFHDENNRYLC